MRVTHIIPGTGGTFYCQNCMRDGGLVRALRRRGVDVLMTPMYLPILVDAEGLTENTPVFFGGINAYLQQRFALFRHTPRWLDRLFDLPWMLRQAATRDGSMSPADLGPMTLSMLRGRDGNQRKEVERLTAWLSENTRPDVVHVSNALLLGVAREIKRALNVPIVCTLQDEDTWLDAMREPWRTRCWDAMAEDARDVDAFISVSEWYAGRMRERIQIPRERIFVVPVGIEADDAAPPSQAPSPPVLGYLSRMGASQGFGILVDAFIELKRDARFKALRFRATGGHTAEDEGFLAGARAKLDRAGVAKDVELLTSFRHSARREFLRSLSVLSVPAPDGEAFGTFILEALAAGVPVVQPAVGAFPEVVAATGGGIVYDPNKPGGLTEALAQLLLDGERARELARRGREVVAREYTTDKMAERTLDVYARVIPT